MNEGEFKEIGRNYGSDGLKSTLDIIKNSIGSNRHHFYSGYYSSPLDGKVRIQGQKLVRWNIYSTSSFTTYGSRFYLVVVSGKKRLAGVIFL
jgi:hypothetical protein